MTSQTPPWATRALIEHVRGGKERVKSQVTARSFIEPEQGLTLWRVFGLDLASPAFGQGPHASGRRVVYSTIITEENKEKINDTDYQ
jgi:hypothetical protein